jgi:hypothetical protein
MPIGKEDATLIELVGRLVTDVPDLFRKEAELAKVEVAIVLRGLLAASRTLAIGSLLAIGATGVLIAALVSGLAALLVYWGVEAVLANAISAALVGLVIGAVAWLLISRALASMRAANEHLEQTAGGLAADVALISESLR